jgi:carbonic anhydrase
MRNVSRRLFMATTAASGLAILPASGPAQADSIKKNIYRPGPEKDGKSTLTADQVLDLLRQGNQAFVQNEMALPDFSEARRLELAGGQAPFCACVSCSDSRVPTELLFGRGLGELFIIRNAGNTIDTTAMGSLEYAVAELGVPLVVVMGHQSCGAVKAAMSVVNKNTRFPGHIDDMIEPIIPAVLEARTQEGDALENAIKQNVRRVVRNLREESGPLLMAPLSEGRLKIAGAYYSLATGEVDFFDQG